MLKAIFSIKDEKALETAVDKFKESVNTWQKIVQQGSQIAGDNQAVMMVIGIMSDMGHDSLVSVSEIECDDCSLIEDVKELPIDYILSSVAKSINRNTYSDTVCSYASICKNRGELKTFFNLMTEDAKNTHSDIFRKLYFQFVK